MADRTEWTTRVAAWRSSKMTARAFCAAHGYAVSSLYLWASKLQREAQRASGNGVKLARVVRESLHMHDDAILIELGALRVRLSTRTDVERIEQVLVTMARMSTS